MATIALQADSAFYAALVAAVFKFSSYKYLQENKLGPHGDHQESQLSKFALGPGTMTWFD